MEKKSFRVVAAVCRKDGKYLITQRRKTAVLPLYWEFPGGKVEPGESDEVALKRELKERLGADFKIGKILAEKEHQYKTGSTVTLALYEASLEGSQVLLPNRVEDFKFVPTEEMGFYSFPDADQQVMGLLNLTSD